MTYIIRISDKNHRSLFTSFKVGTYRRKLGCSTRKQINDRLAELDKRRASFTILEFDNDRDALEYCADLNLIFSEA